MNKEIEKILSDSAWYKGRKKSDLTYIYEDLKNEKLTLPNDVIYAFFEEFENVVLEFLTPDGKHQEIHFSSERGLDSTFLDLHAQYELIVKEPIVPIGTIGDDVAVLEMGYSGTIYMIVPGEGIYKLGNNLHESLELIVFQRPFDVLYQDPGTGR